MVTVLTFNCGSSTLKFRLLEVGRDPPYAGAGRLARGIVDGIGSESRLDFRREDGGTLEAGEPLADHAGAARAALAWLRTEGLLARLDAVGHRVVHGGERFDRPVVIDGGVIEGIVEATQLAPLHNGPALAVIRAAAEVLGRVPAVAVFDTAFHRHMPDRAALYAIPPHLAARHRVRRYGFHGLAHRFMVERYAEITAQPLDAVTVVTLQLGAGCSAAAIRSGRPVDTSMGFTPLEGLMMATRSGDVDPSLAAYLAEREGVAVAGVVDWLNNASGLLGVSGSSGDMRQLLAAEGQGDRRAAVAVEMFCYRARKYVGAYLAALGGAQAVLFGGGIGENAPSVRARICAGMEWCGLALDDAQNAAAVGSEARISTAGARLHAYVIPVDEEAIIARDTVRCLAGG